MREIEADGFVTRPEDLISGHPSESSDELIMRSDAVRILAKHFDVVNGDMRRTISVSSLELAEMILSGCVTVARARDL